MNRLPQLMLIFGSFLVSWLGMQAVHEFGHVIGAIVTGAQIRRVSLDPLSISRTDLGQNPHPLFVVWAGPVLGSLLPLVLWSIAEMFRWRAAFVIRFFAGFCLIANGAYIGVGSFDEVGDCKEMLISGSPLWGLWMFGLVTVSTGLFVWHGLGSQFGLGSVGGNVNHSVARGTLVTSLVLFMVLLVFSR